MNLDATPIAIRERGFTELLDLALRVLQIHAIPLTIALVIGATPWAVLNGLLIGGWVWETELFRYSKDYVTWLIVLVSLETPFATALITLYLGQATFSERIDTKRIVTDFIKSLPQLFFLQGFCRALTWVVIITAALPYFRWPFLSELILLERNPFFAGKQKRITTLRRSRNFHRGYGGELFLRWMGSCAIGTVLLFALLGGLYTALAQIFSYQMTEPVFLLIVLPIGLWLVVGYFAVVRFLCYLDLRIRREGWEVELKLRAAGARLQEAIA